MVVTAQIKLLYIAITCTFYNEKKWLKYIMEFYVKYVIFANFMKNNVNFDPKKEINKI